MKLTKKILIIKLSAIGDVVMSLAMIDALKKYYGDIHITWVCGEIVKPILEKIEGIDEIITVNENNIFNSSKIIQLKELTKIWGGLLFNKYDKIIIGHTDWRFRLLASTVLSKKKVAFGFKQHTHLPLATKYHGINYLELATDLSFVKNNKLIYPFIVETELPKNDFIQNISSKKILLFPGGANNTLNEQFLKRWDISHYIKLSEKLTKDGFQVILSGAKSDDWVNEYFNDSVINLIGKSNLLETISLIKQCDLVVTHDSGPLHLSALLARQKTVGLFGATPFTSFGLVPNVENISIITANEKPNCMPCYDGRNFANCANNICMKNILVEDVYNKIIKVLSEQ